MSQSTCRKGPLSELWPPKEGDDGVSVFLRDGTLTGFSRQLESIASSDVVDPISFLSKHCDILSACLAAAMSGGSIADPIARALRRLRASGLSSHIQVSEAVVALCHRLIGGEEPLPSVIQWDGGATPLQRTRLWGWAQAPQVGFQGRLGWVWALLGMVTKDEDLVAAAERVATWQCHTLDGTFLPHLGVMVREEDADMTCQLVDNYLLFHAVAVATKRGEWQALADRQYALLKTLKVQGRLSNVLGCQRMADAFLEAYQSVAAAEIVMNEEVADKATRLMGRRTSEEAVLCTLCGGGTSLGSYRVGTTAVVAYGPQMVPLGDCRSFGIVTDGQEVSLEKGDDGFALRGRVRLAGVAGEGPAQFRQGRHPGMWLEVSQTYRTGQLEIAVDVMSLQPVEGTAFVFFAKADSCGAGATVLMPRSLDRYHGVLQPVTLSGDKTMTIHAQGVHGLLEVIPLAGDRSFWGADFLIAYHLDLSGTKYAWTLRR